MWNKSALHKVEQLHCESTKTLEEKLGIILPANERVALNLLKSLVGFWSREVLGDIVLDSKIHNAMNLGTWC